MCEKILWNCKIWKQPKKSITEDSVNNGVFKEGKNEWRGPLYTEMNSFQDERISYATGVV